MSGHKTRIVLHGFIASQWSQSKAWSKCLQDHSCPSLSRPNVRFIVSTSTIICQKLRVIFTGKFHQSSCRWTNPLTPPNHNRRGKNALKSFFGSNTCAIFSERGDQYPEATALAHHHCPSLPARTRLQVGHAACALACARPRLMTCQ